MKEFYVQLNGLWCFDFRGIKANSEEAAIEEAIKTMNMEFGSIELDHIEQFVEEEGGCGPGWELGDMPILNNLDLKYAVAKNKKNVQRLRKAAGEGDADAQHILGYFYRDGVEIPKDLVKAHKWLNLAVSRLPSGNQQKQAQKELDNLERVMTPEQVGEAHKLARDWNPQPSKST